MKVEPINLTHQQLLSERFHKMGMEISEYTFANVYLFRNIHQFELVFNRDIYIKGIARDKSTYLMPTTPASELNIQDLIESFEGCDFIFPIQEEWKPYFPESQFKTHYLDEESDYLYDVNTMKTFPGRKLSGRRNLLKQFQELFPSHYSVPLTVDNLKDAQEVLAGWQKSTHLEESLTDYAECLEAISLVDKLGLNGQLTYIENKPTGFILGEKLNSKTYVIHFAKGLAQFKGIYQYLYHTLANFLAKNYLMINLEQDMGAIELRHAKRAYQPNRLLHKLRIKLCKQEA